MVFPAFAPTAAGSPPVLTEERFRTHRATRSLLSRLAEPQPLVLVLDDLHWADAGSIELLSHLLAHPPLGPVLLVAPSDPRRWRGSSTRPSPPVSASTAPGASIWRR